MIGVFGVLANGGDPVSGMKVIAAPLLLGCGVASVLATALAVRIWASALARDRTPDGLGLFLPRWPVLIAGGVMGAAIAGGYIALAVLAGPEPPNPEESFMAQAVARGGLAKLSWAVFALVFAPLYEEVLFRGLMWKGISASWGKLPAAVLVTAVFTGLHYSEVKNYWPAAVCIGLLAVAALGARVRTGSLATAIAVHFTYNAVIVATAYLQS